MLEQPLRERNRECGLTIEVLDIRRPGSVGVGHGHREFAVDLKTGRHRRVDERQAVQRPCEGIRPEREIGAHAADEPGLGLKPQRGARTDGALPLEQPDRADRTHTAQVVRGREAHQGLGRVVEQLVLLELRPHPADAREQPIRIEEGHLSQPVVDLVVPAALQQAIARVEALAPRPDLNRAQTQRRSAPGPGRFVPNVQDRLGCRPLGAKQKRGRAVQ